MGPLIALAAGLALPTIGCDLTAEDNVPLRDFEAAPPTPPPNRFVDSDVDMGPPDADVPAPAIPPLVQQPGYRAGLYPTTWPADMADLNRSGAVLSAGLPRGIAGDDVEVHTVEMDFPVFTYTRARDEVFVVGGTPLALSSYVAAVDGQPAGQNPVRPHITRYRPSTGEVHRIQLNRGSGLAVVSGALMHDSGFVFVISKARLYKINPDTMRIVASVNLPLAPGNASTSTVYSGLTTHRLGRLITRYYSPFDIASALVLIDPINLQTLAVVDQSGGSAGLSVQRAESGDEHVYHVDATHTFRMRISADNLSLDNNWVSPYDPYGAGPGTNEDGAAAVVSDGRVYYMTNRAVTSETPMRVFWQRVESRYTTEGDPLGGALVWADDGGPGWNLFPPVIDPVSGIIITQDQAQGRISASRVSAASTFERLWTRELGVSARPAIVIDRELVYCTDFVDGVNHLVALDLTTGDELTRVPYPATRPTMGTIVPSTNGDVYLASNEPGQPTGQFHRFYAR